MPWPITIICDRQVNLIETSYYQLVSHCSNSEFRLTFFFNFSTQIFSNAKLAQIPLTTSQASILSWSVHPRFARPDVMNNTRVAQLTAEINTILSKPEFNRISYGTSGALSGGPIEQLLRAAATNCTQLILHCDIGKASYTGWDCCRLYFDPNPYFTQSGKLVHLGILYYL